MVKFKMHLFSKFFAFVLLFQIFVSGLALVVVVFSEAQTGLITTISSDTTWTADASPHALTGPLLVKDGATLTIGAGASASFGGELRVSESATLKVEPGATLYLNDHEILVNGSIVAKGTSSAPANFIATSSDFFTCRNITFTSSSSGWDEKSGSGSIFEHIFLEKVNIVSKVPLKMDNVVTSDNCYTIIECDSLLFVNNHVSFGHVFVGASSIVQDNNLKEFTITGSTNPLTNNIINSIYLNDCSLKISNCDITGMNIHDCSLEISNNFIHSIEGSATSLVVSDNTIGCMGQYHPPESTLGTRSLVADSAVISNNIFKRYLYLSTTSAIITNNTITGYFTTYTVNTYYGGLRGTETRSYRTDALNVRGSAYISGNIISEGTIGIRGGTTIEGNLVFSNKNGIFVFGSNVTIRNNNLTSNNVGISGIGSSEVVTIENNWISGGHTGIEFSSPVIVRNNTIIDNNLAIKLIECPSAKINYNNVENYDEYAVYLEETTSNIDATDNWWGTTNIEAIGLTMYDSKYLFDVGTVTFSPFLTEENAETNTSQNPPFVSSEIPEFSSFVVVPLFVVLGLVALFFAKRFGEC